MRQYKLFIVLREIRAEPPPVRHHLFLMQVEPIYYVMCQCPRATVLADLRKPTKLRYDKNILKRDFKHSRRPSL